MKQMKMLFSALLLIVIVAGCSGDPEKNAEGSVRESGGENIELFISAAVSLTDAMHEIKLLFEEENNVELTFNFASSGKLAQQIRQGAPVDVFVSANENWMDTLIEENLIKEDTLIDVTGNKLVLIVGSDSPIEYNSFEEIKGDVDQIAIGNPESVPAGEYTEVALKTINKWDELKEKFVFAQNVRQVLTYVETGNAEIGFVYASDAMSSKKVKVLAESDSSMHDTIIYPGAVTAEANHTVEGELFIELLTSERGQEILRKYGFNK